MPDFNVQDYPLRRRPGDFLLLRVMTRLASRYYGVKAKGLENIPANGPYIICANHQSFWDNSFVCDWLPVEQYKRVFVLFRHDGLEKASFMRYIRVGRGLPIRRDGDSRDSLSRSVELLRGGDILFIFPEGTYSPESGLGEFHEGFAYLAKSAGVNVLPVRLEGTREVKRSGPVSVTFFPVINPADYSMGALARRARDVIAGGASC
jgi:1-acyl-sn-glycerol-3-phosphate acyltransferase